MMKYILCLCLAIIVSPAAFAAALPDGKAIEGNWTPVKAEFGGQPMPNAVLKTINLKLADGKYAVIAQGQPDYGTYTIDATTQPKSMTVTGTDGPNKGQTFPCIYELKVIRFVFATIFPARSGPLSSRAMPAQSFISLLTSGKNKRKTPSAAAD